MEEVQKPIRINRYLAIKQLASRREADRLIGRGLVHINGRTAVLGDQVNPGDRVTVVDRVMRTIAASREYLAYHKPVGIVTHGAQEAEQSIADVFRYPVRLFPVGRLDKDSHGLMILTNDGRITDRLLNPAGKHEKEYIVEVDRPLDGGFEHNMAKGVDIGEGERTAPCKVRVIASKRFRIILTEGKKRQIRRMCKALGYAVRDLLRVRIMNIKLDKNIEPGSFRKIRGDELADFLRSIGLEDEKEKKLENKTNAELRLERKSGVANKPVNKVSRPRKSVNKRIA